MRSGPYGGRIKPILASPRRLGPTQRGQPGADRGKPRQRQTTPAHPTMRDARAARVSQAQAGFGQAERPLRPRLCLLVPAVASGQHERAAIA